MLLLVPMSLAGREREASTDRGARLARPTGAIAALCAIALAAVLAGCDGGSSHHGGGYFETTGFGGDVLAGAPGEPIVDTFRQEAGGIRWDEDFDRLRLVEIFISANRDLDFVDEIEVEAQDRTLFGGGSFDTIGRYIGPPPPGTRSVVLHLRKDILDAYVSSGGRIELKLRVTGVAPPETVALFGSLTVFVEPRD